MKSKTLSLLLLKTVYLGSQYFSVISYVVMVIKFLLFLDDLPSLIRITQTFVNSPFIT